MASKYFLILLFSAAIVAIGLHELGNTFTVPQLLRSTREGGKSFFDRKGDSKGATASKSEGAPLSASTGSGSTTSGAAGVVGELIGSDHSAVGVGGSAAGSSATGSSATGSSATGTPRRVGAIAALTANLVDDTDKDALNSVVDGAFDRPGTNPKAGEPVVKAGKGGTSKGLVAGKK